MKLKLREKCDLNDYILVVCKPEHAFYSTKYYKIGKNSSYKKKEFLWQQIIA